MTDVRATPILEPCPARVWKSAAGLGAVLRIDLCDGELILPETRFEWTGSRAIRWPIVLSSCLVYAGGVRLCDEHESMSKLVREPLFPIFDPS